MTDKKGRTANGTTQLEQQQHNTTHITLVIGGQQVEVLNILRHDPTLSPSLTTVHAIPEATAHSASVLHGDVVLKEAEQVPQARDSKAAIKRIRDGFGFGIYGDAEHE